MAKNSLNELLYERTRRLSNRALQSGGKLSDEELAEIDRLARLADICRSATPAPSRKRWPVVAILLCTLVLISALLFARLPETEIELDLTASDISFTLATEQTISDLTPLTALGVSGLEEVRLPSPSFLSSRVFPASDHAGDLAIRLVRDGGTHLDDIGTITLAPIALGANSQLRVSGTGMAREYRVSLVGAPFSLRAAVNGPIQIDFLHGSEHARFPSPREILLRSKSEGTDLDLRLPDTPSPFFSRSIKVKEISFLRVEQYVDLSRTLVRSISTIEEGILYRNSLNAQKLILRPGETLSLGVVSGEVGNLRLHNGFIRLSFFGRVQDLTAGFSEGRRSLMPTYLEWLHAQHRLSLFWAAALYVFGLLLGVLRWWGFTL